MGYQHEETSITALSPLGSKKRSVNKVRPRRTGFLSTRATTETGQTMDQQPNKIKLHKKPKQYSLQARRIQIFVTLYGKKAPLEGVFLRSSCLGRTKTQLLLISTGENNRITIAMTDLRAHREINASNDPKIEAEEVC